MKALLYCVKSKPYLHRTSIEKWWWNDGCYEPLDYREGFIALDKKPLSLRYKDGDNDVQLSQALNGKIVAEVEIDKVEEIKPFFCENVEKFEKETCLTMKKNYEYLDIGINELLFNLTKETPYGYALHLTNLKVFDRPYNLNEWFNKEEKELTKAPQNMCYCYHWLGDKYVLISIQPQHLCNILNGKKTIEVRRKVLNCLKEMLKND